MIEPTMLFKRILIIAAITSAIFSACEKKSDGTSENKTTTSEVKDSTGQAVADVKSTKISFAEPTYEFGKIKQGDLVKHTFVFKNEGENPLIISNATASCGCTVPQWPKDPIAPGEEGKIEVQFNSTGKSGIQNKSIVITANTSPNTTTVNLKGEVEVPVSTSTEKAK